MAFGEENNRVSEGTKMNDFLKTVRVQAAKEVADEQFRKAVAEEKARIKSKRSLWDRLFPWTITIRRKA